LAGDELKLEHNYRYQGNFSRTQSFWIVFYEVYYLWQEASDKLGSNRPVPDTRSLSCRQKDYEGTRLPPTSVIITFHNEARSTLLRTIVRLDCVTERFTNCPQASVGASYQCPSFVYSRGESSFFRNISTCGSFLFLFVTLYANLNLPRRVRYGMCDEEKSLFFI
jgi:hypothetical protein